MAVKMVLLPDGRRVSLESVQSKEKSVESSPSLVETKKIEPVVSPALEEVAEEVVGDMMVTAVALAQEFSELTLKEMKESLSVMGVHFAKNANKTKCVKLYNDNYCSADL